MVVQNHLGISNWIGNCVGKYLMCRLLVLDNEIFIKRKMNDLQFLLLINMDGPLLESHHFFVPSIYLKIENAGPLPFHLFMLYYRLTCLCGLCWNLFNT